MSDPLWDEEYDYIVNDNWAEIRKALKDGKNVVWYNPQVERWEIATYIDRNRFPDEYAIL